MRAAIRTAAWVAGAGAARLAGGFVLDRWVQHVGARHIVTVDAVESADVAVVLGCRIRAGRPLPMLEDRLFTALELLDGDRIGSILVSGGPDEVVAMEAWLAGRGVPDELVSADREGYRTHATVLTTRDLVGPHRPVVFCTQRFHAARTAYLAVQAGLDARVAVADRRSYAALRRHEARETLARMRAVVDGTLTRQPGP